MKVSILGNGLTSLALAKSLVNKDIKVDIFSDQKNKKYNKIQTLGISKQNIDYFCKNILNIKKLLWKIDKIEIFNEKFKNEKLLNFEKNNQPLFQLLKTSIYTITLFQI